jgi:hypothetical protein
LKALSIGSFGLYSGDVNQDGAIDLVDLQVIENQILVSSLGYQITDCDGNLSTNNFDLQIAENNAANFLFMARP